jgi:hypothetical protein
VTVVVHKRRSRSRHEKRLCRCWNLAGAMLSASEHIGSVPAMSTAKTLCCLHRCAVCALSDL